MNITIDSWCQPDCTLGRLFFGNFHCFTLELPWKDNAPGVSCIPIGSYPASRYHSPHLDHDVLLLSGVPGRQSIEVHFGNYTRQIEGCILVGDSIRYLDSDTIPDVTNSRATLEALLTLVPDSVTIDIRRAGC